MRRHHQADFLFALTLFSGCLMAGQTTAPVADPTAPLQYASPASHTGVTPSVSATSAPAAVARENGVLEEIGGRFAAYRTDNFMLVHASQEQWAQRVGEVLEKTHQNFYATFRAAGFSPNPVGDRLVWVCFDNRNEFDDYALKADRMDMSWSKGYYSTRTNRVALLQRTAPGANQMTVSSSAPSSGATGVYQVFEAAKKPHDAFMDIANATHEAAHQLAFNSGLQKRGVMYPLWASEGMAANFEADDTANMQLGGENPSRKRDLLEAYRSGRIMDTEDFVILTRLPFGNQQQIHDIYAHAWGFFRFLITERREDLQKYLTALNRLEPGRRDRTLMRAEFVLAFGPLTKLDIQWQKYLAKMHEEDK